MEQKKVKKIGFLSAFSICFTSVVGIGIFLKNAAVGKNVDGNGISWLITWVLTGLLALLLAFNFGKISRLESSKGLTGLNGWTDVVAEGKDKWFKKIVSVNYGLFYLPILALCLSFFCAEFFVSFLQTINPSIKLDLWIHVILTICLLAFFVLNNYFSVRFSGYISLITSILKFIPLLLVIVIGVFFATTHNGVTNSENQIVPGVNGFTRPITFDKAIQGIMLSIPGVLFAFDSFIGVGVWSKNIKGGQKSVSKVIVFSLIFVTILYSLICVASILHYSSEGTSVINVLVDSLPQAAKQGITIFVSLMIFISAFGTSNSLTGTTVNEYKNLILNESVIMSSMMKNKFGDKKGSLVLCVIVLAFWSIVLFAPALIMNNDAIIDGFSNLVVVGIFLVYAYLIFLFWKNIYKKGKLEDEIQSKTYDWIVWAALIGTLFVSLLNLFYVFLDGVANWDKSSSWGGTLSGSGIPMNNLSVLITYLVFFPIFFAFPFINHKLINKTKSETFSYPKSKNNF